MVDLGALGQARNPKRAHTQGESCRPLISQGALDRPTAHRAPLTGWTLGCAAIHVRPPCESHDSKRRISEFDCCAAFGVSFHCPLASAGVAYHLTLAAATAKRSSAGILGRRGFALEIAAA